MLSWSAIRRYTTMNSFQQRCCLLCTDIPILRSNIRVFDVVVEGNTKDSGGKADKIERRETVLVKESNGNGYRKYLF